MSVSAPARSAAVITEHGRGRPVHVVGADVTIKISSRDTAGAFCVFEGHTEPLEGPPLHLHRDQDEWWYIVDGEYLFEVDGKQIRARAGDTVFAARGTRHTFQNIGTVPGWTITTAVPGGLDLFFEELEAAAPRGAVPDAAKVAPIFEKYNLELLGPPLGAR